MSRFVLWLGFLTCLLLLASSVQAQQTNCRKARANVQNAGSDIVVSSTPVTVLEANTSRCTAVIFNYTANDMRCRDVTNDGVPSATTGHLVSAGHWLTLGLEGQGRWQCIRVGGSDATVSVLEDRP